MNWAKTKKFWQEYDDVCKKYNYMSPKQYYRDFLIKRINKKTIWLDAGCGWTITLSPKLDKKLVKKAKQVYGVDVDKNIHKHTSIKNLVCANLENIPLKDEKFNLITCNFVVEHLDDPVKVFREFHRLLKKEGELVISTPNIWAYDPIFTRITSTKFHKKIIERVLPKTTRRRKLYDLALKRARILINKG